MNGRIQFQQRSKGFISDQRQRTLDGESAAHLSDEFLIIIMKVEWSPDSVCVCVRVSGGMWMIFSRKQTDGVGPVLVEAGESCSEDT